MKLNASKNCLLKSKIELKTVLHWSGLEVFTKEKRAWESWLVKHSTVS